MTLNSTTHDNQLRSHRIHYCDAIILNDKICKDEADYLDRGKWFCYFHKSKKIDVMTPEKQRSRDGCDYRCRSRSRDRCDYRCRSRSRDDYRCRSRSKEISARKRSVSKDRNIKRQYAMKHERDRNDESSNCRSVARRERNRSKRSRSPCEDKCNMLLENNQRCRIDGEYKIYGRLFCLDHFADDAIVSPLKAPVKLDTFIYKFNTYLKCIVPLTSINIKHLYLHKDNF